MSAEREAIAKLLIVDDEVAQMTALCNTLEDEGYAAQGFTSPRAALAALREQEFELLLTDLKMPGMDGIELLRNSLEIDRNLVVVVMTGHGTIDTAVQAMQAGAIDYIQKPFKLSGILPVLHRALTIRRLRTQNIELQQSVAIYKLSSAFTMELDRRALLEKVADAAYLQSNQGEVAVMTIAADESTLRVVAARGARAEQVHGRELAVDATFSDWIEAMRTKLSEGRWSSTDFCWDLGQVQLDSQLTVPMLSAGKLIGLLAITNGTPVRTVTAGQIKALTILASTAGSALEVAALLDELRRTNDDLERRVQARTAQLQAANQELEAFSYSVSHDLRAPLRSIIGYADMLLSGATDSAASDSRHAIESIHAAGERMRQLIGDLLSLARIGKQALESHPIDVNALVQSIVEDLRRDQAGRAIEVKVSVLPECHGDESLIRQVWVNLLSNAWKFTARRNPGVIEVGSRMQADACVYFVRDNGAGFDMNQADKLFGAFKRLHSANEYDGTGVGLSIAQRIVERHGGRIWAEGRVDAGATFYFTLPRAA